MSTGGLATGDRRQAYARYLAAHALPPAILLALFAEAWQLLAHHNPYVLPQLGAVVDQLVEHPGQFAKAGAVTLEEAGVGLATSVAVAFPLAALMTYLKLAERAVMPLAVVLSVTPAVALAPGLNFALGVGLPPRFLVTAIVVFFPLLVNSLIGLKSADPEALRYFATLDAHPAEVLFRLRLPSALPFLFSAARICFPLALVGAVVSEWSAAGSENGLGSLIQTADLQSQYAYAYAAIACLSVLGLIFTLVVIVLEHKLLFWHPSSYGYRRS